MKFAAPLQRGRLVQRYKRFLADIILDTGEGITATCPNTGSMLGLCDVGATVFVSRSDSHTRKYAHTWHLTEKPDVGLVGIDTSLPNKIVEEAVLAGRIPALGGYSNLRREVKYGENSRIDLFLSGSGRPGCYVEVKNVTLLRRPGLAEFPDCPTARGAKHLREMSAMVAAGQRAVMVYLIQCATPTRFSLTRDLDAAYVESFAAARNAGVEALAFTCHVTLDSVTLKEQVPVIEPA